MHAKVTLKLKSGPVQAIAPKIISASRETDLPAFFADWFMNRLREGWCTWVNPYNGREMYVSFEKCKTFVFWSKNPEPLRKYLDEIDRTGRKYYFQFTLNNYEKEGFEPHVPSLEKRIETFVALSETLGKDRVIWRYDPVLKTDQLSWQENLDRIRRIGETLCHYTKKLVFSYIDIQRYAGVQRNLRKPGLTTIAELSQEERLAFAEALKEVNASWKQSLTLATCAEDIDLSHLGIEHNHCIDGELIDRIWHPEPKIQQRLLTALLQAPTASPDKGSETEVQLTALQNASAGKARKDSGQRKACGCIESKDIGAYNTCRHGCVYCYANYSPNLIQQNWNRYSPDGPRLITRERARPECVER